MAIIWIGPDEKGRDFTGQAGMPGLGSRAPGPEDPAGRCSALPASAIFLPRVVK